MATETVLFRKEPGEWGVPREKVVLCEFVVQALRRDFGMGHAVTAVKWFHLADDLARDGDAGVFRALPSEAGFVTRAEPGTIWLRRELCRLPDARLIRILVHEVMHVEQLARGSPLPVDELEREADDLVGILCRGLA